MLSRTLDLDLVCLLILKSPEDFVISIGKINNSGLFENLLIKKLSHSVSPFASSFLVDDSGIRQANKTLEGGLIKAYLLLNHALFLNMKCLCMKFQEYLELAAIKRSTAIIL